MYPNITLEITNFIPKIIYKLDENTSKEIINTDESLTLIINPIARGLNLIDESHSTDPIDLLVQLLKLSAEGNQYSIDKLPKGIENSAGSFELDQLISKQLKELLKNKETFDHLGNVDEKVIRELEKNQNVDILATLLDYIYFILISKTVFYATDLGIGQIVLNDQSGLLRLQEIMADELQKLDIALEII